MSKINFIRFFTLPCVGLTTMLSCLSGCSGHDKLTLPSDIPAPAQLVKDASTELDSLTSVHVDIEALGDMKKARLITLIADVVQKPIFASAGHLKFNYEGSLMEGDYRIVNNQLYVDHILGPQWYSLGKASDFAEKYNIRELDNNEKGNPQILDSAAAVLVHAENIKADGAEKINNILTEKITGTIQGKELVKYYPNVEKRPFPIELWIEANGKHRLVRSNIIMEKDSSSQLTMSDWDKGFTIQVPPMEKSTTSTKKSH